MRSDSVEDSGKNSDDSSALYRFLSDNAANDRDFETLKQEKIYAPPYAHLNDPLDAPMHFVKADLLQNLPNNVAVSLAENLLKELNEFGIYCLSSTKSSHLMWSHYANRWKGLCIEYGHYNRKDFFSELRKTHAVEMLVGGISMSYPDPPVKIDSTSFSKGYSNELLLRMLLGQKTPQWEYEKEFRLLFKRPGLYHMPSSLISGVYLGYAMESLQKEKYVELLSSKEIPVWEVQPDTTNFQGVLTTRVS